MSSATPDYSEHQEEVAGEGQLAQLSILADRQADAEHAVARLTADLAKANDQLRSICEHELPALMDELGMQDFTTTSGLKVTVRETIRASIPKDRKEAAFDWLDEHGHSSLVKRMFAVSFGRDEEKWARKFAADLRRRKRELSVDDIKKVESSTLRAFVKNQLEEGLELPLELFGVFRQRRSKIG
jgi:hypothetical protein